MKPTDSFPQSTGRSAPDKPLGRRFPAELDKAFVENYFQRNLAYQRRALLGVLLLMLIFGLLHIDSGPHVAPILLAIHYLFLCPALTVLFAFSFHPAYRRWSQQAITVGGLIFGATFLSMEAVAPTPANSEASQTTVVLILVIIVACIVLRLRYFYAVVCSCLIFIAYAILSLTVFHLPHAGWNLGALFVAYLLESFGVALLEKTARNDFLLRRTLVEQNRRLDELAASRLQAARDVEHEIKNKLDAISKPMEVALRRQHRGLDTDGNQVYLEDALRGVRELKKLLQTMLNIARMAAGHPPRLEEPESTRPDEIITEVCDRKSAELTHCRESAKLAAQNNVFPEIRIEMNLSPSPTLLYRYSLRLVLENLLDNAIKYSVNGGTISLHAWETEDELFVRIADQGIGIAPERLPELFNALYERGYAEEHNVTGTGIGLNMIRRLVEAQEGRIWAESDGPGHGAAFFLTLPRKLTQPGA